MRKCCSSSLEAGLAVVVLLSREVRSMSFHCTPLPAKSSLGLGPLGAGATAGSVDSLAPVAVAIEARDAVASVTDMADWLGRLLMEALPPYSSSGLVILPDDSLLPREDRRLEVLPNNFNMVEDLRLVVLVLPTSKRESLVWSTDSESSTGESLNWMQERVSVVCSKAGRLGLGFLVRLPR